MRMTHNRKETLGHRMVAQALSWQQMAAWGLWHPLQLFLAILQRLQPGMSGMICVFWVHSEAEHHHEG